MCASGTRSGVHRFGRLIRGYHPSQARGFNPRPWICEPSGFKKALNPRLFFLVETDAFGLEDGEDAAEDFVGVAADDFV